MMKTKKVPMKLILIGLLSLIDFSESRAVNISNTWTLPQPGFNVFYRYFRDKISFYEADAVCNFHHGNLVTVENIEQFDAAREFLKELDISDYVWIGLMRPSNADQFSWTNSKPLPISEGYWAEPWPVSETPLCAVIDPARDYRWHALKCGGPETSAFLCEMEIPDWALHCTENPEITVQYISDSGAVQLSRHCQDNVYKEISCQGKMTQMAMYDELKCPEEQSTTMSSSQATTVESLSTTEESRPEVIIKNPQKMLEDVFNDVETNIEVDSNRLDVADAKKELDFMFGDQPVADDAEDKKTLLKLPDKKEVFPKKTKNTKKESKKLPLEEEPMMGDAPAEEAHDDQPTTVATKLDGSTTDRQRRDALETTLASDAKDSTEATTQQSDEAVTESASTIPTPVTTEAPLLTTVTDEPTTKNIVQGHPLFHNHAIFKEPISVDNNNGSLERKDVSNTDDHFIPPMLLVKARFTATKSTEGTEETKEMTTDAITESSTLEGHTVTEITDDDKNVTSKSSESNDITNEISSVTQVEVTPSLTQVVLGEQPILIEKRNDPRLGLNVAASTTTTTTQQPSSTDIQLSSTDAQSPSTTDEPTTFTEEASSTSVSYESSVSEISTTESQTETTEMSESSSSESPSTKLPSDLSTTIQPESTGERLIESTTQKVEEVAATAAPTSIAIKLTTLRIPVVASAKLINKSTPQMGNDIDEIHESSVHETIEADDGGSSESHHVENNLNNEDNLQPYKPNRHREISHSSHHGPGFSIGKILG